MTTRARKGGIIVVTGYQGAQGHQGERGYQGDRGHQGDQGERGYQGNQGYQGNTGNQGTQGFQGEIGSQGEQGDRGYQGYQGYQGNQGFQGEVGAQGTQGSTGSQGFQGHQGTQGFQGNQGHQGNQGVTSVSYEEMETDLTGRVALASGAVDWNAGAIFTRTLSAATTLSFSNLKLNKVISLIISGNYDLTFPASVKVIAGEYDKDEINYIQLHCTNTSPAEVWCSISQEV